MHTHSRFSALCLFACASFALAGPINPPAGPVAPTPGPEPRIPISDTTTPGDADSLFRIANPGSYYLTGNVNGVLNKRGIEIGASRVTIDLNGFTLNGGGSTLDGIAVGGGVVTGVTITNGNVTSWGGSGVNVFAGEVLIESVHATSNGGTGIAVSSGAIVRRCTASGNAGTGIVASTNTIISECISQNNGNDGFTITAGGTVTSCVARGNTSVGFFGNSAGAGGLVFNNCASTGNGEEGYNIVTPGSLLTNCTAEGNDKSGFKVSSGGRIVQSVSESNIENGFELGTGGHISGCSARLNKLDGILASGACTIRDNSCVSNGQSTTPGAIGAGIHTTGTDNRIEGNNCTTNDRGLNIDSSASIILRNTCSGNTINWEFAANNVFGPIIDRTVPGSGSVSGNSAAETTGSTHPNANFTY
jgi:hypothetical protein